MLNNCDVELELRQCASHTIYTSSVVGRPLADKHSRRSARSALPLEVTFHFVHENKNTFDVACLQCFRATHSSGFPLNPYLWVHHFQKLSLPLELAGCWAFDQTGLPAALAACPTGRRRSTPHTPTETHQSSVLDSRKESSNFTHCAICNYTPQF